MMMQVCYPVKRFLATRWLVVFYIINSLPAFSQVTKKDPWVITTTDTANYTAAYLANGMVGLRSLRSGLGAERVIINALYDRSISGDNIRLINYFNPLKIKISFGDDKELQFEHGEKNWKQTLNLKEAILETSYNYGDILKIKTRLAALRNIPMAALSIYEFEAIEDVAFTVTNSMVVPERRKTFSIYKTNIGYNQYSLSTTIKEKIPVIAAVFPTESGTDCVAGANTFYFNKNKPEITYITRSSTDQQVSFTVKLKKGESFSFSILSAFTHSALTSDAYNDAVRICSRDTRLVIITFWKNIKQHGLNCGRVILKLKAMRKHK